MRCSRTISMSSPSSENRTVHSTRRGATAVFFACMEAMVRALLAKGADARRILPDGTPALDAAACEGDVGIVRALLEVAPELATEDHNVFLARDDSLVRHRRADRAGDGLRGVRTPAPL